MKKGVKKIVIGVVIVAIVAVLIVILPKKQQAPTLQTQSGNSVFDQQSNSQAQISTNEFKAQLLSLQSLELNDSILSSSLFLSLNDFSKPINLIESDRGRSNPFAPIGFEPVVEIESTEDLDQGQDSSEVNGQELNVSTSPATNFKSEDGKITMTLNGMISPFSEGLIANFIVGFDEDLSGSTQIVPSDPITIENEIFSSVIVGFLPDKTYYYQASVDNGGTILLGNIQSFTTTEESKDSEL